MFLKKRSNSQMSFFVSIGAGVNQIPLIREARRRGFHVIGVDTNPMAPGFMYSDLKIQESILDHDEIYKKLSEMLFDGTISGIMSRSYGEAIRTTAYLSERFNIPFIPFSMTDCFINKRLMKNTLLAASIPTPEVVSLPTGARLTKPGGNFFPLIRKPVEGHAKIGVRLINNIKQLKESIPSQAEKKNFIFEKYIEGDEIIVAGVVHHGRFHVVDITDKTTTQLPYFVDLKHVSPSRYYHLSEMISSIGQSVARAFSIVNSPVIMEFIVDNNGNLHLIEAAPEFGGEFLADVAIPIRTGYNFIGEAIKANTGMNFRPPSGKKSRKAVVVRYITDSEGTLQSFNPEGPKHIRGVVFSRIFKEIGAAIKPPTNNLDRIGVVITKARTPDEADEIAERAVESLQIRIRKQS